MRERLVLGSTALLLPLVLWEVIPRIVTLPRGVRLFLATPSQIAVALGRLVASGELQQHFTVSATEFLIGLGLSIVVGLPLGVLFGRVAWLDDLVDPFVTALNATPRIVWLPLLILWFGLGIWSKVLIVFLGAVFPLLVNTYEGVRNADRVLVNVVRSFGGSSWQVARRRRRVLRRQPRTRVHDRLGGVQLPPGRHVRRRARADGALTRADLLRPGRGGAADALAAGGREDVLSVG
ncbi:MAG: hypothetical protein AUH18_11240 [Candidatus Rokubacteria bacterium 13_2_20CM_69_10]|nr:MAG: hypothetical protein AUH18_11240 [Candidatus Rokubacteria bacterium 13_2_20CM_69_10]